MKRRWLQFRLRTLFGLLTLAAVVTGVVQHVWYVRERIQFHQAKVVTCEERRVNRIDIMVLWMLMRSTSNEWEDLPELEEVQTTTSPLPEGHLLFNPSRAQIRVRVSVVPNTFVKWDRLTHVTREAARIEDAKLYHQEQVEQYRHALWRPWLRVAEDHNRELPDELPDIVPRSAVPQVPPIPPLPILTPDVPPIPLPELERPRFDPPLPESPEKVKLPWQSIERSLPRDFNKRDLQLEKAASA